VAYFVIYKKSLIVRITKYWCRNFNFYGITGKLVN